ncbi:MAG: sigma-54 dependent transcriptional regulator [Deltaproteobacteria bacterium]|nr:sigma-54 dependent transcriptional regulator [Deltaproteobacteria bacterium]MDD9853684.1 sigma-54 dependent transcriptional regulator [Deltaproteobacteria bacterium]MDD9871910.1 sigma-54 dependent transcriptional regulator [Deltaproteobacteria bacterium]
MSRILIVDDEQGIRRSLSGLLSDEGFETSGAADGEQALAALREESPNLVLLDIAMPGRDGIAVLEELRRDWPQLPVVMMSGHGTIETAVRATQLGAFDFIEKPLSFEKLLLTIRNALEAQRLADENRALRAQMLHARELIGEAPVMKKLKEQILQAAPTNGWVLISGENGTGKELVAKQLHVHSARNTGRFVEVNCAAIPEELIESELFGHEKGAFTGAIARKQGRFELAHGGTIFLDEIADMSLRTQAKILRILQEHKFERVGGSETIEVDVRVIAATNKDLEQEMRAGNFREDLYYRLNVIPFRIAPLRERREDIPALVAAFVGEFCAESGARPKRVASPALRLMADYAWPGNVRELRNLMERLVLMTPGLCIEAADLPPEIVGGARPAPAPAASLDHARKEFERSFLAARLAEHGWNISRTAEAIGIARESLSRKLRQFGIRASRD